MRRIYMNISAWAIQIVLIYVMFTALLSGAYEIAFGAMLVIYYIEFLRENVYQ